MIRNCVFRYFRTVPLTEFDGFMTKSTRASQGMEPVDPELPFDISYHPSSSSAVGENILKRLTDDMRNFAEMENSKESWLLQGLLEADVQVPTHNLGHF